MDYSQFVGKKFGRYTVIENPYYHGNGRRKRVYVKCICECGIIKKVRFDGLRSGHVVSCGCYNRYISSLQKVTQTHGLSKTRIYKIWKSMRGRCNNPNGPAYKDYGGRGIKVCKKWDSDFMSFYEWSMRNGYQDHLEIDRIRVNGGYTPSNCRWGDEELQANNKRNNIKYRYKGRMLTLPQIARKTGIRFSTLYRRVNENKLSINEALKIPLHHQCGKEAYGLSKFNKEQIISIYLSNKSASELAKEFNMSTCNIYKIKGGKMHKRLISDHLKQVKK